jgi:hypothetical protein
MEGDFAGMRLEWFDGRWEIGLDMENILEDVEPNQVHPYPVSKSTL